MRDLNEFCRLQKESSNTGETSETNTSASQVVGTISEQWSRCGGGCGDSNGSTGVHWGNGWDGRRDRGGSSASGASVADGDGGRQQRTSHSVRPTGECHGGGRRHNIGSATVTDGGGLRAVSLVGSHSLGGV